MGFFQFAKTNAPWLMAGLFLTLTSSFGQTFFISIFAGEIRAEFNLSHGAWGGIYAAGTTASAVVMVWTGVLTDRFRVRQLGSIILVLLALSCLFMGTVQNAWMLGLAIFALRFTGQGMLSHIAIVSTARWFVATRGRALSIVTMGFAIGQALLPLIFVALLAFVNWRSLWAVAALITFLIIPILLLLLRNERTPQSVAAKTHAVGMNGQNWVRGDMLKHWLFWLMFPLMLGPPAWGTAFFFQQVHTAEVKGWSHVELVSLFPLFTLASIFSTFVTGWAIDRYGTNRLMPFYLFPHIISFCILGYASELGVAAVGMMVMGLAVGAGATLPAAFWAEHFGTKNLGGIKAIVTAVMVFGSAIGPGVSGALIDLGIPFPDQLFGYAVYFAIATVFATIGVRRARLLLPVAA